VPDFGSYSDAFPVIPANAGIQESWMLDRVQHDKARASPGDASENGWLKLFEWDRNKQGKPSRSHLARLPTLTEKNQHSIITAAAA